MNTGLNQIQRLLLGNLNLKDLLAIYAILKAQPFHIQNRFSFNGKIAGDWNR